MIEETKINRLQNFFEWLYGRCQNVHYMTDEQMENIIEKL